MYTKPGIAKTGIVTMKDGKLVTAIPPNCFRWISKKQKIYEEKFCNMIVDFFSVEPFERFADEEITAKDKKGKELKRTKYVTRPNKLPTFAGFARYIGVSVDSLSVWRHKYPYFAEAYAICKDLQKEFLVENALNRRFDSTFSIFLAKNITDLKDVRETKETIEVKYSEEERTKRIGRIDRWHGLLGEPAKARKED